jgi:hypothetical protein
VERHNGSTNGHSAVGSILSQTQMALSDLSSPFFQTKDLKTIELICNIGVSSWNKYYHIIIYMI